jgi:SNF2 family DNA or RNA helicase
MSVAIFLKMKQESEVSSIGNDDESGDEDSDEKMMTRRALVNVFELRRRKNRVSGSGPKLTIILLSTPLPKTVESVMTYCQNLKQNHHLNSLFFRICGTFV